MTADERRRRVTKAIDELMRGAEQEIAQLKVEHAIMRAEIDRLTAAPSVESSNFDDVCARLALAIVSSTTADGGVGIWGTLLPVEVAIVVDIVGGAPNGRTVGELVERLGLGVATVSAACDSLSVDGWIKSEVDAADRRRRRLTAEPKAIVCVRRMRAFFGKEADRG